MKTLKDFRNFALRNDSRAETLYNLLKREAIKRAKMIKKIFLDSPDFDKSPAKTQREAYFHQKGKFDEIVRFYNITQKDLTGFKIKLKTEKLTKEQLNSPEMAYIKLLNELGSLEVDLK